MKIRVIIYGLCIFICTNSCVDEFWPNVDKYENLLTVDCILTDGGDPVIVKLSYSNSINNDEFVPVLGAEVFITEGIETIIQFDEIGSGVYQILDSTYKGKIGNVYKLTIQLSSGESYESDSCMILESSPIDSLFAIRETKQYAENKKDRFGYQFYLCNHNESQDPSYYLWLLTQTYEYKSTFDIDFTWEGEIIPFPNPDSLRRCWNTTPVKEFFTYSTENLVSQVISDFPLNFTSTRSKKLSIKYSLFVRQLSINEQAYHFWDALKNQNIEQGSLFSKQPVQIIGNVHNVVNREEPVLGYFTVASVTKKRIFVNRPTTIPFFFDVCQPDLEIMGFVRYEPPENWPIYLTLIPDLGIAGASMEVCFDCRFEGGSITPPAFWEDK